MREQQNDCEPYFVPSSNNCEVITATPGLDGIFVGPGDLSLRLKHAPDAGFDLDGAEKRVAEACKKHGMAWGMPARDANHLRELTAMGAQLASHGSDFMAMVRELESKSRDWAEIVGE